MDPRIQELCINNSAPSHEIVQSVRKMVVKPLQDLKDLDVEILALERRLQELKNQRNDAEKWIIRYQSILSPIRALPQDVLGEIFQHCLPHTNPIVKGTESPLLLTRVCKLWRSVALSQPRLWSRIHISFTNLVYRNDQARSRSRDDALLRERLDIVKEWLSYSGTLTLSISIVISQSNHNPENSTMELLRFLAQLAPRIQDLDLGMKIFRRLEKMIDPMQMTSLTSLRISDEYPPIEPCSLLKAPKLARISASGLLCNGIFWGISDPSYASAWRKLTHISSNKWMKKNDLLTLFGHTTNLVHLAVIIYSGDEDVSLSYQGPTVSLPFPRTLFISDVMRVRNRGDFYDRIDAPGLKWIMYAPYNFVEDRRTPYRDSPNIPIIPLLSRSTGLEKLSINPPSMEFWDMRNLLRVVPSITHLFIGYEPTSAANRSAQMRHHGYHHHLDIRLFNFQLLLHSNESPLLPKLQSFEINTPYTVINDNNVLRFIKYRMSPLASSGLSALKHFAAAFYRPRGRNLVEEIRQHAQFCGVKMIELFLGYDKPRPLQRTQVPEPGYGLKEVEVPTGLEANVDNYVCFDSEIF